MDLVFQERLLRESTKDQVENWSKVFYMPTSADRFVGGFRQWLNRFGGKGVKWAEGVDPRLPPFVEKKEDLLDRYNSVWYTWSHLYCQLHSLTQLSCQLWILSLSMLMLHVHQGLDFHNVGWSRYLGCSSASSSVFSVL